MTNPYIPVRESRLADEHIPVKQLWFGGLKWRSSVKPRSANLADGAFPFTPRNPAIKSDQARRMSLLLAWKGKPARAVMRFRADALMPLQFVKVCMVASVRFASVALAVFSCDVSYAMWARISEGGEGFP